MKFLIVTNMYPTAKDPFYGIFVKEHVESLRKHDAVVDVVLIYGKENRLNYFLSIVSIFKQLLSAGYDIINVHHTYCVFPVKIAQILHGSRVPVVLSFHEGETHFANPIKPVGTDLIKGLVFSKKLKKLALNLVDFVVSVQEDLVKLLHFSGKYQILPCGVDSDLFKPTCKEMCRQKLGLPLNKKIVFFPAATQNPQKGFDILTAALTLLKEKDLHVLTAGHIRHEDMPTYMGAADVVVQLSIFEASPMVLKEALATNTPVVFTDVGDAKQTVGNAKGAFLCNRTPQDVASKLNEAFHFTGNSNGRKRILDANLTLHATSKHFIEICEGMLRSKRTA